MRNHYVEYEDAPVDNFFVAEDAQAEFDESILAFFIKKKTGQEEINVSKLSPKAQELFTGKGGSREKEWASILAKEERDRSLRALSQKVGFDVGSGYPSDPITKNSLHRLVLQSGIDEDVRWGWATVERFWSKHRSGDVPVRGRARTEQQRLFQSE